MSRLVFCPIEPLYSPAMTQKEEEEEGGEWEERDQVSDMYKFSPTTRVPQVPSCLQVGGWRRGGGNFMGRNIGKCSDIVGPLFCIIASSFLVVVFVV